MGQMGILATVVGPEYAQLIVSMPAPGIPVTVYWLEPLPVDGIVTLVAVMANGVAASALVPESPQPTARNDPKRKDRRRFRMAASFRSGSFHPAHHLSSSLK
jgi:hypothetical protein